MSPILLRPVREQLEHDRVIRLLQAKYKRKFEVAINPGNEQVMPIVAAVGQSPWFPDLVLQSNDRARKLRGVVEVETAESVNNLEAMSQWATFARLRAPFHLYVPAVSIDTAKRLCSDLQISVAEMWAFHLIGDQMRFTLVQRLSRPGDEKSRATAASPRRAPAAKRAPAARRARASRPPARPVRRAAAPAAVRRKAAKKTAARPASRKSTARPSRAQKRK